MSTKLSLAKEKIKILLLEGISPSAVENFARQGYSRVTRLTGALAPEELVQHLADTHMLGIRSRTLLDAQILRQARKLMAVGCFCIGTNQVDLAAAVELGIPVFNAPHANTRSVAELVIGLTVMLVRGIFPKSMAAHRGIWAKSAADSNEVRGKIIGIVGYGHIGSQVSVLAEGMGMQVRYFDIQSKLPLGNAKPTQTLEELLALADVVTLHVPEDKSTRNLLNAGRIAAMKPGACLINASRGSVVTIDALAGALDSGALRGAAVDVLPQEPKSNSQPLQSRLVGMDKVIITPHIGGSTQEAQENIGIEVAGKLIGFSDRGATDGAVNFPQVNLPIHTRAHRILHIHRNVPGVIGHINEIMAARGINVLGQYLSTQNELGYVVLDIARERTTGLRDALAQVDGTIRVRMLY